MKCANCIKDAMYEYRITQEKSMFYCGTHLPSFLEARRKAGLLTLTPKHNLELESAISAITSEKPSEEPKPAKKATKKKAE